MRGDSDIETGLRTLVALAVLGLVAGAATQAAVYEAPSPEPTPEETLMLEYMNRLRRNPIADMERIAPQGGPAPIRFMKVDWDMFRSEMRALKEAPPLVFNLDLLEAARKHSHYMILNQLTHIEEEGKPGFTGKNPGDRVRAAGYRSGGGGENCYRDARDPWQCHLGFVVDFGPGGTGGMQPGRGHRMNMMNGRFKEVGIGALPHSGRNGGRGRGRISVTHNFGGSKKRFAGGVVYVDKNKNDFYDLGEGRGGVKITLSDGTSVTTWPSGAYTIPVSKKGPVTITASMGDLEFSKTLGSADENVKFDWVVPQKAELELADKYIAGAESAKTEKDRFAANVALWLATRPLGLDPLRMAKVEEIAGKVGRELDEQLGAVREALENYEAKTFDRSVRDRQKLYRRTVADGWFKEALILGKATRMVENTEKQAPRLAPSALRRYATQLEKTLEATAKVLKHAEFRSKLEALKERVKPLAQKT